MYKIGEFSKKVNENIKTIRYYDEINLLKPNIKDKMTNYRYYNDENIKEYYEISILRDIGFTLVEIKELKNNIKDEILLKKKHELLKDIKTYGKIIRKIDLLRSNIENEHIKINEELLINIRTRKKE